ncbi:unnamed protein product [Boreogadus saida]
MALVLGAQPISEGARCERAANQRWRLLWALPPLRHQGQAKTGEVCLREIKKVYHCGTPRYMEPHILGWRPLRLIYFLFLRPSLMTSMW